MKIAVQDANVLIDLELAGLFESWFSLGIETHTTDFVLAEVRKGGGKAAHHHHGKGSLRVHALTFEELAAVSELVEEVGNKAGFNDCTVLFLAEKLGAMLISGDKALRSAGKARHVEVHGTLWILGLMVDHGTITKEIAAQKLNHLLTLDRHLPRAECESLLKKWHP